MIDQKTPEEIDDTAIGLYRLSELVLSFLETGDCGRIQLADLAKAYSKIVDALNILGLYDQAGDEDLGATYSELVADAQDLMSQLEEDGIVIRLH